MKRYTRFQYRHSMLTLPAFDDTLWCECISPQFTSKTNALP